MAIKDSWTTHPHPLHSATLSAEDGDDFPFISSSFLLFPPGVTLSPLKLTLFPCHRQA